jgi:hypothetical protein
MKFVRESVRSLAVLRRAPSGAMMLLLVFVLAAGVVEAQDEQSTQIWGNVILDHPRSEHLLFELDMEPKTQITDDDGWRNLDVTPLVEFYPNTWVDLVGEINIGYTRQVSDLNTFELTPRLGIRLHLLNNLRERLKLGVHVPRRLGVANLTRIESRNFWYSADAESRHEWRLRNRTEFKLSLNHQDLHIDRTLYLIADFEVYFPLADDIPERFATKLRARAGVGYRANYKWRLEALYIRERQRITFGEDFVTSANIVDVRLKLFF